MAGDAAVTPALTMELVPVRGALEKVAFRRSTRANKISLRIDPAHGGIVITLPPKASRRAGLQLLQTHEDWVAEKLAELPGATPFLPGAAVPVDGVPHIITPTPQSRGGAWIADGAIYVTGGPEFLARRVTDCLRRRWGSCAPDGTLAFCWRLICAPPFVQDYVVGHEVAHLRHMNHGRHFWALTEELTPHRAAASAWLGQHGQALLRIG